MTINCRLLVVRAKELLFHVGAVAIGGAVTMAVIGESLDLAWIKSFVHKLMFMGPVMFLVGSLPRSRRQRIEQASWEKEAYVLRCQWKTKVYTSLGVVCLLVLAGTWTIWAIAGDRVAGGKVVAAGMWLLAIGFLYKAYDYRLRNKSG